MKGETTYNQRMSQSHHMNFIMDHVVEVYSSRSHLSETDVMSLLHQESWLNAQECLDMGLVDKII